MTGERLETTITDPPHAAMGDISVEIEADGSREQEFDEIRAAVKEILKGEQEDTE